MIEGNRYIETIRSCFSFLVTDFGFRALEEEIRGNAFYDVQYKDATRVVSISYENIEDYLLVIVFLLQNGKLPDFDDKTKTLHLDRLNEKLLPTVSRGDIDLNNQHFLKFKATNEMERRLLKSARELRLCLKHFEEYK